MILAFIDVLNHAADVVIAAGREHFLQTTLLAGVLALIDFTLGRRIGPHWRCALWLLFFAKLALPPHLALPSSPAYWFHRYMIPPAAEAETPVANTEATPMMMPTQPAWSDLPVDGAEPTASAPTSAPDQATESVAPNRPLLLVMSWSVIALGLALGSAVQRMRLRVRLRRNSSAAPAAMESVMTEARAQLALRRRISLRLTETEVGLGPLVLGLWRPRVYLPRKLAAELNPDQLRAVLAHELLHVRRGDLWVAAIQSIARVLFFYHPVVWWVNAHLARLREEATDRAVLYHTKVDAGAYSLALVAAAELGLRARPLSPFALGVMETQSQLGKRIKMNLYQPRPRRAHIGSSGLLALAALALVLIPMAPAASSPSARITPAGFKPADAAAMTTRIDAATDAIFGAFNRRDRDAYLAAFATDALILAPGGPLQQGRTGAAQGYLQAPPGLVYAGIQWKDRQCYRIGPWWLETGLVGFQFKLHLDAPVQTDPRQAFTIWEEGSDGVLRVKMLAWNPLSATQLNGSDAPAAFVFAKDGSTMSTEGDFRAVLDAEETFHRAFEEQRMQDAADYYATHAVLFSPETPMLRGSETIRRYLLAVPAEKTARRVDRSVVHVEGNENHVLVVNLFRWTFIPAGDVPVAITGKGVHLWQRDDKGVWKVLIDLPNASQPNA